MISSNSKSKTNGHQDVDSHSTRPGARAYLTVTNGRKPGDLIAEARAAGRDNLPRSDAEQLSDPENTIHAEHARQHLRLVEQTRVRLRELEAAFETEADQLPRPRDLGTIVEGALARVEGELGDERLLIPERRGQQRGLRDLRHLVAEQSITRPARYPQSKRLHLAWVAVLATIEAVGNAAFFAGISSIGWLGGLVSALGVAILNTGSAVLVGYTCLRGLHHHRPWVRRLSTVGLIFYAILIVAFNLALGRARDLAAEGALSTQALPGLLRHPLDLSLMSVALVGLGLVAVAIALAKGRSLEEVIPEYGPLHRRFVEADQGFARSTDTLRNRVVAHVDAIPDRLRAEVRRAQHIVDGLEGVVVDAEKAVEAYESDRQHLETECGRLLRQFRSANERVRSTRPPAYFATVPSFPSQIDSRPIERLKERLATVHGLLDEFKVEAHRIEGEQKQRVQATALRFEKFHDSQVHRADVGRGDPSEDAHTTSAGVES